MRDRIGGYEDRRNDPNAGVVSDLSPYLHFGQISAQRIAMDVIRNGYGAGHGFLEELIVRRELAENFCFYNALYDRVDGFPDWARRTLARLTSAQKGLTASVLRSRISQTRRRLRHDDGNGLNKKPSGR